jgi:ATP-dependent DNA helicase RecG
VLDKSLSAMATTIGIEKITDEQRIKILGYHEGHFGDLKAKEIAPAKLSRSVSAFANATGGELFIGIEETTSGTTKTREWKGFPDMEAANNHIQVFDSLFPLGQAFAYSFLECDGAPGLVLHVQVRKTRELVPASDGKYYVRRGPHNMPVTSQADLERLRLDKGIISFEGQTVNTPIATIADSYAITGFMIEVIPTVEPEPWLRKQSLILDDKPTVAGVLLFSDEPQAQLPKRCGIKLYRYATKNVEGSRDTLSFDPISIEGCLYDQIRTAVDKTVEIVQGQRVLGPNGLEPVQYPHETLHEIITNAVLHRDYSIAVDVHIRIFDNRIEIESPGKLPGHVTQANILKEQLARNGALVRLINKFPNPPNKDVGEGLNTAFQAMRSQKLKDPVVIEKDNSVLLVIPHERLASPEDAVMTYLDSHEEINNSTGRELTGITSENAMKEVFYRLRDRGLIERTPGKSGSAATWRKKRS